MRKQRKSAASRRIDTAPPASLPLSRSKAPCTRTLILEMGREVQVRSSFVQLPTFDSKVPKCQSAAGVWAGLAFSYFFDPFLSRREPTFPNYFNLKQKILLQVVKIRGMYFSAAKFSRLPCRARSRAVRHAVKRIHFSREFRNEIFGICLIGRAAPRPRARDE